MDAGIKTVSRYVFPAVGGLCITYLYNIMDGIFVGQGVGSAALGAVNIGVPFITSVVAVVAMFPMGGAAIAAIRMGRGDKEGANHAFMTALVIMLMYGKEASNRKQEIDRQHHTIPNQRPKDKHYGNVHNRL